jgi:hypothetical protein
MMNECAMVAIPKTAQELEQAIRKYKSSELKGMDLFCQWQAIRWASLEQSGVEKEGDRVPGADSY